MLLRIGLFSISKAYCKDLHLINDNIYKIAFGYDPNYLSLSCHKLNLLLHSRMLKRYNIICFNMEKTKNWRKQSNKIEKSSVFEEVKDMVYTHAVLCESMRLCPPVPTDTKEAQPMMCCQMAHA
ncbi:Cytochrome P450 94A2 [Bienertia sinuspersici]